MIPKNLKKSKSPEFNSAKLSWDSKYNTKEHVGPVTLNFMVKGFFYKLYPYLHGVKNAHQSFNTDYHSICLLHFTVFLLKSPFQKLTSDLLV